MDWATGSKEDKASSFRNNIMEGVSAEDAYETIDRYVSTLW